MFKKIILVLLTLTLPLHGDGFIAGTLVTTSTGTLPIEELEIGDTVICSDNKNNLYERTIVAIKHHACTELVTLEINDTTTITVSGKQLFFLPYHQKWYEARDCSVGDHIATYNNSVSATITDKKITYCEPDCDFYSISVDEHHNFYATQDKLHAHNFVVVVTLFTWTIGEGVTLASTLTLLAAAGTWIVGTLTEKTVEKAGVDVVTQNTAQALAQASHNELYQQTTTSHNASLIVDVDNKPLVSPIIPPEKQNPGCGGTTIFVPQHTGNTVPLPQLPTSHSTPPLSPETLSTKGCEGIGEIYKLPEQTFFAQGRHNGIDTAQQLEEWIDNQKHKVTEEYFNKWAEKTRVRWHELPPFGQTTITPNSNHALDKKRHCLEDTPENRKLLQDVAGERRNYHGKDQHGNDWFALIRPDGSQVWVSARDGQIRNGGINTTPLNFHPLSGFSSPDKKTQK